MPITLTPEQRRTLRRAAAAPGGAVPVDASPDTVAELIDAGYLRPQRAGHPHRVTPAGRAAVAGDERGAFTWQRLTPDHRRLLCALDESHIGGRPDPATVPPDMLTWLVATGYLLPGARRGIEHAQLAPSGSAAVARLRGDEPAFSEAEITHVAVHELCAGDSLTVAGHRWIAATAPELVNTFVAYVRAWRETDPTRTLRSLTLGPLQRLPR